MRCTHIDTSTHVKNEWLGSAEKESRINPISRHSMPTSLRRHADAGSYNPIPNSFFDATAAAKSNALCQILGQF
jgi:hypothetical protein